MVHAYMAENSKAGEQNQRPPRAAKLKPKRAKGGPKGRSQKGQKAAQRAAVNQNNSYQTEQEIPRR